MLMQSAKTEARINNFFKKSSFLKSEKKTFYKKTKNDTHLSSKSKLLKTIFQTAAFFFNRFLKKIIPKT